MRQVQPWLQPEGPEPETEYLAPERRYAALDRRDGLHHVRRVRVGLHRAGEVDDNFLGPAALAKAYRFVRRPARRRGRHARWARSNEYGGIWDCTRCMQCVEVCPKGVDPMGRIMALRDKRHGGRIHQHDRRSPRQRLHRVRRAQRLARRDQARRQDVHGITNVKEMLKLVPVGLRAMKAGKMPPLITQEAYPTSKTYSASSTKLKAAKTTRLQ